MTTITRCAITARAAMLCAAMLLASVTSAQAAKTKVAMALGATGATPRARGKIVLVVRSKKDGLTAKLKITGKRLAKSTTYEITVDGVRLGTLTTNKRGAGRARFRSASGGGQQFLGVDPRGRRLALLDGAGAVVLIAAVRDGGVGTSDGDEIRCCLPDDSDPECEDRTPAECTAQGGVDLGPGSCLPNPCEGEVLTGADIQCCLPDDSGPECEDRTEAECSAAGGVNLGAGSCVANPCAPATPTPGADVRCCLPDDSGAECEDRTAGECAAQGGVNIGTGSCVANSCPAVGSLGAVIRVTCEQRGDRSKISVDGNNLAGGIYSARVTSEANSADAGQMSTVGDEAEFDFDSAPDDIAAGAVAIPAHFIQGNPPRVMGQILDAAGAVVIQATATCEIQ